MLAVIVKGAKLKSTYPHWKILDILGDTFSTVGLNLVPKMAPASLFPVVAISLQQTTNTTNYCYMPRTPRTLI